MKKAIVKAKIWNFVLFIICEKSVSQAQHDGIKHQSKPTPPYVFGDMGCNRLLFRHPEFPPECKNEGMCEIANEGDAAICLCIKDCLLDVWEDPSYNYTAGENCSKWVKEECPSECKSLFMLYLNRVVFVRSKMYIPIHRTCWLRTAHN